MKKNIVSYDGNDTEDYELFLDGEKVATMPVGEDAAIEIVKVINTFIKNKAYRGITVNIQNDNDKLGVIIDLYKGDDNIDSLTLWFDDYIEGDDDITREEVIEDDPDEDEDDTNYYVDVPQTNGRSEWENVGTFDTRDEALAYAKETFGADDNGKIKIVTGPRPTLEELLEDWSVSDCEEVFGGKVPEHLKGWFAVNNRDGVVAYFGNRDDAYYYRLNKINLILNS
jgi:hypothetical protein